MPKPQNALRKFTTIMVSKDLKRQIRCCAKADLNRTGYEKDNDVIQRLVDFYRQSNETSPDPHPTY